jgi:hypothetical protein
VNHELEERLKRRDPDMPDKIANTRALTRHNFRDNALTDEIDVVTIVYTSDKTDP